MPKYARALDIKLPVLPGFYPDPSVVRVGDTYYVANSTFEYGPGVPIHSSKDLLTWTFVGHALQGIEQANLEGMVNSMGIFAPTLRHHNGKFYLITTLTDGKWQVLTTADTPAGPWSPAVRVDLFGIDPDLFWDEDGNCYMAYASLPLNGIGLVRINTETGEYYDEPKLIWQGLGGKFPEGPHIYHIGDWYYLLIAEGGTERGHAVSFARSRSIYGPYEADPMGVMLSNRGTDYAIQNTGHADLVQRADDSWAMMFHGTRPRGGSPEWHVMGRETCAVNIEWREGWPRIAEPIQPAEIAEVCEVIDATSDIPAEWIMVGGYANEHMTKTPAGISATAFVARRQTTPIFEVTARLAGDGLHGIGVGIDGNHHFSLLRNQDAYVAMWRIGEHHFEVGRHEHGGKRLAFKLASIQEKVEGFHAGGPDKLVASVVLEDGTEVDLARIDGRYVSTEVAGGMTGRVVGVLALTPTLIERWEYCGR
jgi:xylan 1,4-beta-xylosidase